MSGEKTAGGERAGVTCRGCNEALDEWGVFVVYGEFDADRQGFERGDHTWHVCHDCWHREYDAPKATHYQTDDPDELRRVLDASGGQLVADLSAFFIPGPCYVRVVGGEVECATVARNVSAEGENVVLDTEPEAVDDPEILDRLIGRDAERPIPIYLRTADETPFRDLADDVKPRRYPPDHDDMSGGEPVANPD